MSAVSSSLASSSACCAACSSWGRSSDVSPSNDGYVKPFFERYFSISSPRAWMMVVSSAIRPDARDVGVVLPMTDKGIFDSLGPVR